jgi:hypothetical protein
MKGEKKMEKLKKTMEYLTNIGFTKLSAKPVVVYNNDEIIVQGNITIDFCLNEKMANKLAKTYHIPVCCSICIRQGWKLGIYFQARAHKPRSMRFLLLILSVIH